MKQAASSSAVKNDSAGSRPRRVRQAGRQQPTKAQLDAEHYAASKDGCLADDQPGVEQPDLKRLEELPKEVGVMLIAAGIVGLVMPGPGTPALIAGGLVLWPGAFRKLELWLEQRHPAVHHRSMKQIGRFLDDLEKRYPNSRRG